MCMSMGIFSQRNLAENERDYYSGKFFLFFSSDNNVCVVDTFSTETTKLLDRPAETNLS